MKCLQGPFDKPSVWTFCAAKEFIVFLPLLSKLAMCISAGTELSEPPKTGSAIGIAIQQIVVGFGTSVSTIFDAVRRHDCRGVERRGWYDPETGSPATVSWLMTQERGTDGKEAARVHGSVQGPRWPSRLQRTRTVNQVPAGLRCLAHPRLGGVIPGQAESIFVEGAKAATPTGGGMAPSSERRYGARTSLRPAADRVQCTWRRPSTGTAARAWRLCNTLDGEFCVAVKAQP